MAARNTSFIAELRARVAASFPPRAQVPQPSTPAEVHARKVGRLLADPLEGLELGGRWGAPRSLDEVVLASDNDSLTHTHVHDALERYWRPSLVADPPA